MKTLRWREQLNQILQVKAFRVYVRCTVYASLTAGIWTVTLDERDAPLSTLHCDDHLYLIVIQLLYTHMHNLFNWVNDIYINSHIFSMSYYQDGHKCHTERPLCAISLMTPPFSGKRQSRRERGRLSIQRDDYLDPICIQQTQCSRTLRGIWVSHTAGNNFLLTLQSLSVEW